MAPLRAAPPRLSQDGSCTVPGLAVRCAELPACLVDAHVRILGVRKHVYTRVLFPAMAAFLLVCVGMAPSCWSKPSSGWD
jgi:hypothetical protein